ncbi:hypothetical protein CRUP_018696 [Coryphaenoides rupestris]|nr:hypothetical protein CRUP_018696 [Coryphaenoides rupestris]
MWGGGGGAVKGRGSKQREEVKGAGQWGGESRDREGTVGGAVVAVLLEDGSGPLTAQLYSLNMLVQTEGRERTAGQYRALLGAAGFGQVQVRYTGKIYDVLQMKHEAAEPWYERLLSMEHESFSCVGLDESTSSHRGSGVMDRPWYRVSSDAMIWSSRPARPPSTTMASTWA